MKKVSNTIDKQIGEKVVADAKADEHKPSGKLSASRINWPVQWQVLNYLGVPTKEIDEYTRRKFIRGKQVEDWLLSQIETKKTQEFVEYKGVIGYYDALVDASKWDFPMADIPLEVKSVTNFKFRRIMKDGAQEGHILQNGVYALGLEAKNHAVAYVASDDLRVHTFVFDTEEHRDEIDARIVAYQMAINSKEIPVFQEREGWQSMPKYASYPDWIGLNEAELQAKAKELYARS